MSDEKRKHPATKAKLHKRNKHRERYNFASLTESSPVLKQFVAPNKYGDESIDFADPKAVKALNSALLAHHYGVNGWDIPEGYLCPPIPGRADYIHHISDVLCASNFGKFPKGEKVNVLDVGIGSNCVYPIVGTTEYGWSFVGSDIDQTALDSAQNILNNNPELAQKVELRFQDNVFDVLHGIINKEDKFDLTICNPPFHSSAEEAQAGSLRKQQNLKKQKVTKSTLNFGGQNTELWCEGGEKAFIRKMIQQSRRYAKQVFWFSTIVAKQTHLKSINAALEHARAVQIKTIPMGQGNKSSRIVAWTFLNSKQQEDWRKSKWA